MVDFKKEPRDGNKTVKVIDPKTKYISQYSMSIRLRRNLDKIVIPALMRKDKDYVMAIDGAEGSGKSTLAFQIGKYVDPSLNLNRIVFTADEFREAIFKAKKGQCIIYDEAFTGFSSRASLSSINRVLVSLMMQMRQKNLFVIVVLPTFFLLDKYVALFRAKVLVHVFESQGRRGYFRVYNSRLKKYLYLAGQKTYSYHHKTVRTRFHGRFYGKFALGDKNVEEEYKKRKARALMETEKNPLTGQQVKFKEQRDLLMYILRKTTKMTYAQLSNYLDEYEFNMSYQAIQKICGKFGDIPEVIGGKLIEKAKKEQEMLEKLKNKGKIDENREKTQEIPKISTKNAENLEKTPKNTEID